MIDNTMPERIYAGAWPGYWYPTAQPLTTQYIRADVAQAQLDAANARIAELETLALTLVNELEDREDTVIHECSSNIDKETKQMRARMDGYRQQIKPQS